MLVLKVVQWYRALDLRLSDWCCSVSMVWIQIPSREEKIWELKNLILALFGLIFRRVYIYIPVYIILILLTINEMKFWLPFHAICGNQLSELIIWYIQMNIKFIAFHLSRYTMNIWLYHVNIKAVAKYRQYWI